MSQEQTTFPLLSRIIVLVFSSVPTIGIPIAAVQAMRQQDGLDAVNAFLMLVFFAMGCGGVWVSLFWKNRTSNELAEEQLLTSVEHPCIPEDALVFRFPYGVKPAAIYLDRAGLMVHFHDCHTPRRFLSSATEWFSCPINEIQAAHVFRHRGESLTVVTTSGRALIPDTGPGYEEFRNTIKELVPVTRPGFSTDHPMMGMVYLFGALVGLFAGVFLTPRNAGDSVLGMFVLAGTVLGVAGSYLLIWVGDRVLKTSLAQPIGFGVLGMSISLAASTWLGPWIGWGLLPMAALVTTGAVAGGVFGFKKQSRERGSGETSGGEDQDRRSST